MKKNEFIIETAVKIAAGMCSRDVNNFVPSIYIENAEKLWEELKKRNYVVEDSSLFNNSDLS